MASYPGLERADLIPLVFNGVWLFLVVFAYCGVYPLIVAIPLIGAIAYKPVLIIATLYSTQYLPMAIVFGIKNEQERWTVQPFNLFQVRQITKALPKEKQTMYYQGILLTYGLVGGIGILWSMVSEITVFRLIIPFFQAYMLMCFSEAFSEVYLKQENESEVALKLEQ